MTQDQALTILKTGANAFVTGEPGSGKTFVTNKYVKYLKAAKVPVAVTASTGIAATHLEGRTIHSWSGIGINKTLDKWELERITSIEPVVKRIERTKVLVIDEVSMLDAAILRSVDQVCREVKQSSEPFGGMQVIFVGDFFQLPPVVKQNDDAMQFAFTSRAWIETEPFVCYLSEQYRQEDERFLDLLSALRRNQITSEHIEHLRKRRVRDESKISQSVPKLFSHNRDVDQINLRQLKRLAGDSKSFQMNSSGQKALVKQLKKGCLSPEELVLKKDALVMFTKNDPQGKFVNGSLGKVVDFAGFENYPIVKTREGHRVRAEPMDWSVEDQGKVLAKVSQIPLRLAWAITIHKSQGMSMDAAFMDLQKTFTYGQGYVALSRVRGLSGLHIAGWNDMAFQVHPEVLDRDGAFRKHAEKARASFGKVPEKEIKRMHKNFIKACGGKIPKSSKKSADKDSETEEKTYSVEKVREKHSNAYEKWNREEEWELTKEFESGKDIKQIAEIHGRSKGAIRSRLEKLGLVEPKKSS